MDRTVFVVCALALAPVALGVGCDAQPQPEPVEHAPLVLAELQRSSPGPWRRLGASGVAPTALERPVEGSFVPPSALDPAEIDHLKTRMQYPSRGALPDDDPLAGSTGADAPPYDFRIADPSASEPDAGAADARPRPEPITPAAPPRRAKQACRVPMNPRVRRASWLRRRRRVR